MTFALTAQDSIERNLRPASSANEKTS